MHHPFRKGLCIDYAKSQALDLGRSLAKLSFSLLVIATFFKNPTSAHSKFFQLLELVSSNLLNLRPKKKKKNLLKQIRRDIFQKHMM